MAGKQHKIPIKVPRLTLEELVTTEFLAAGEYNGRNRFTPRPSHAEIGDPVGASSLAAPCRIQKVAVSETCRFVRIRYPRMTLTDMFLSSQLRFIPHIIYSS
jgi:hypothetical protein